MRQARAGHDTCGQRVTPRCRWAAGPGRTTSRRAERSSRRGRLTGGSPPTGTHSDQAPQVWRAPEGPEGTGGLRDNAPRHTPACQSPPMWRAPEGPVGLAAVPVGGGGAWTAPHSTEGATGVEGAGGSGGHGRASRSTTPSRRLACGDLAGGRARRRPEHQRCHNETRPRPVSRPRPRHAHAAPFTTAPPAIRRSCPRDPQPRRGQPRGGRRGRGTGSRTRSRHPRCGRSGSTAGRHRAHHTRRA